MHIPEEIIKDILGRAEIEPVVSQFVKLQKSGSSFVGECPECKGKKKLSVTPAKNIAKCFSCDYKAVKPVNFLMKFQNKTYVEAIQWLADFYGVTIPAQPQKSKRKAPKKSSFCSLQLAGSGLTVEDVTVDVEVDEDTKKEMQVMHSGSINSKWEATDYGDDMVFHYLDLEGKPMTFYTKSRNGIPTGSPRPIIRVRWQNPELHTDKHNRPIKYQSPPGSGSAVWIPKIIRRKYQQGAKIKTLYIQEGEKKAEKATKHGMFSLGVMGIHNIKSNGVLPKEFQMIIKKCDVENVVFVLDADCFDLSDTLDKDKGADLRPRTFYSAVKTFRDYFYAMHASDIYLNIFFGHINYNESKDKGVDDLLANALKGKEDDFVKEWEEAVMKPEHKGSYFNSYKITTLSDHKLKRFWGLQSRDEFEKKYRKRLKDEPVFKIFGVKYRYDEVGKLEMAQPLLESEEYWQEIRKENMRGEVTISYRFKYKRCYTFLRNRGFGRYMIDGKKVIFVQVEDKVVREVDHTQIRDFVTNFTENISPGVDDEVEDMLFKGGTRYLGPDSLSNLKFIDLEFHRNGLQQQYFYFANCYWRITPDSIIEESMENLDGHIWADKIKDFTAEIPKEKLISGIREIDRNAIRENPQLEKYQGQYAMEISDLGLECNFLDFILKTSDFYHRKNESQLTLDERMENAQHFLSKVTAIGYLLHRYRNPNVQKAVIAMDGKDSEAGESNGRSGKSLLGEALKVLIPTVYIPGKKRDLEDDRFLFDEVDERTECVFFDDIRRNLDFERFFPEITGEFKVERKGFGKLSIPDHNKPKLFFTTNHAIQNNGDSFTARQIIIGFSDYFNPSHDPVKEYGCRFFDEWDRQQWNLFYVFMAECVQAYLKFGIIEAPVGRMRKRQLRYEMGNEFYEWAEEYFSNPLNLNREIPKAEMYNEDNSSDKYGQSFISKFRNQAKYVDIRKFKKKLLAYCEYKGYLFNPSKDGDRNVKGGVEYITVCKPNSEE